MGAAEVISPAEMPERSDNLSGAELREAAYQY